MLAIFLFVLIIGFLVVLHELGHLATAKLFKVDVKEFGIGFPPRIFEKHYGGTKYSLNAIPLGGFVRLVGEDDAGVGSTYEILVDGTAETALGMPSERIADI
ncbi:MAG: putative zinc metalloprotease [Alphaproteobacteria bacterium MarineAlpha3_Bin1]|nr:MAG: putative zinc metalloprotease [Alphaproteobacteria bacterium MarineAlpha3_Bin1]